MKTYLTHTNYLDTKDVQLLSEQGCYGFRLILKNISNEEITNKIREIKDVSAKNKKEIKLIIDLPGNKPQLGNFKNEVNIVRDSEVRFSWENIFNPTKKVFPIVNIGDEQIKKLRPYHTVLIADASIQLIIKEITESEIVTTCINHSSIIRANRSISFPDSDLIYEPLNSNDLSFVEYSKLNSNIDAYAISFVRDTEVINKVRSLCNNNTMIYAKIENCLDPIDLLNIIKQSDGIILGRGDLSMSIKASKLLEEQEKIIALCKTEQKELIIATGILTSLATNVRPSIAEIIDYSNLIKEGIESILIADDVTYLNPKGILNFINDFSK